MKWDHPSHWTKPQVTRGGLCFWCESSLAPDLLSALERLVHPMADDDDIEHAKELIAKAKGGQ